MNCTRSLAGRVMINPGPTPKEFNMNSTGCQPGGAMIRAFTTPNGVEYGRRPGFNTALDNGASGGKEIPGWNRQSSVSFLTCCTADLDATARGPSRQFRHAERSPHAPLEVSSPPQE